MRLVSLFFLMAQIVFGQNQLPQILIQSVQNDGANQTLIIQYDLADAEDEPCEVTLVISENGGRLFAVKADNATGDIGSQVTPGSGYSISWNYEGKLSTGVGLMLKLVADDGYRPDMQDIIGQVDTARIRSRLLFMEGQRHRRVGSVLLAVVKDSINKHFIANDLESSVFEFDYQGYTAQNLEGKLAGTTADEIYILLGGHFDTVTNSPGADDNGSAVVGMMEAVDILSQYQFEKSVKFIGFDLEEEGLVGSNDYVSNHLPDDEILEGFIDFEMIGYFSDETNTQTLPTGFDLIFPDAAATVAADSFRGNFITLVGVASGDSLNMAFANAAANHVPDLKVVPVIMPQGIILPDLARSDHAPFWLAGESAIMLTDGANFRNPHYHTPNDRVSTLDIPRMSQVVQASIATVVEMGGLCHAGVATAPFDASVSVGDVADYDIRIFPNPSDNFVFIENKSTDFAIDKVELISLSGNVLGGFSPLSRNRIEISIDHLPKGIYLLKLYEGKKAIMGKVVVE